ncbi:unnamed protein product [Periconia digitata]|uniref:S-adenosyl-L-methionine-dependent methyltransferase n=1 Tax=Periconia digitata TaxID=1303443 RepID=A0A9W4USM3_9PLEO|nr:unnamed protein product [Periconia digitata]
MAKIPKVPKTVLPKPPRQAVPPPPPYVPLRARPVRPQRTNLPNQQSPPHPSAQETPIAPPGTTRSDRLKQVWDERPRVSDIKRLTPEQLSAPTHQNRMNKWRQWTLFICGMSAFGMGLYGMQIYVSLTTAPDENAVPDDLSDRFDKEADGYDEKVSMAETMLFLNSRRKALMQKVRGHVLEVAVGTGRNTPYYPTKQCATVTLLDSSAPMLEVAKRKWKETHMEYFSRVFFKHQSAVDPITPPYGAQDGYDTVVQTMGLCSTNEPVKLLHSLEAATKEEDGQILLLEHGKSHYEWLNSFLDRTAPNHALTHGCWWNKDIGKIVEESGLEVVDMKRYNFGTTWWVELKPRKGMRKQLEDAAKEEVEVAVQKSWSWWSFWR